MSINQIRKVGIMMDLMPATDQELLFNLTIRLFKAANPSMEKLSAEEKEALTAALTSIQ